MTALDLQRLRCFLAVAEEKHFARAAARLNMTPPPLSRQIKQLERELGGELFVRRYHDVELTPFGAALVQPVRAALTAVGAVGDAAARLREHGAPLRIGATPYTPTPFLDGFLEALHAEGIDVIHELVLDQGSNDLAKRLVGGSLDLALVHLPSPDDSLDAMPWHHYPLAVAVRNDDPLATLPSVTMEDLRGRRVVHPLGRLHPKVLDEHSAILRDAGIEAELDIEGRVGVAEMAAQVWSRHLVSFVPDVPGSLLGRVFSPPEFVTIPLSGDAITMRLGVAWSPAAAAASPSLRRALAELRGSSTSE
ncbi:MAG: LysR family transcriptional regulator [Microbacterium sp.]